MSEPKPPLFSGKLLGLVTLLAIAFGGLFVTGMWPRRERVAAITEQARSEASEKLGVTVAKAIMAPPAREIVLPANVSALLDTPIYARAEGYLRSLKADIGDVVKKGQVLVELETPELDQSLRQSRARLDQLRAALNQAKALEQQSLANVKLASITVERVRKLVAEGVVSKQDGDDKQAVFEVRQAELASARAAIQVAEQNLKAQEADVARLEELSSFKQVRAPFDGVITLRNAATGNLVTPSAANGGRELFRMSNNDSLRIFISLPQANIPDVRVGDKAEVIIPDQGRSFKGYVIRAANALDDQTRTQRTEVRVVNQNNALLPGMYVQVKLGIGKPRSMVLIPGDTLLTNSDGAFVAVVGPDSKVAMAKVEVGRDLGTQVEILGGLRGGESLVVNPSDAVRPGIVVNATLRK